MKCNADVVSLLEHYIETVLRWSMSLFMRAEVQGLIPFLRGGRQACDHLPTLRFLIDNICLIAWFIQMDIGPCE
jgi:hypothetical protein